MQWWMVARIDGRMTMTVCGRKARQDYGSYVKTVSLKVKILIEGGPLPSDWWKTMTRQALDNICIKSVRL